MTATYTTAHIPDEAVQAANLAYCRTMDATDDFNASIRSAVIAALPYLSAPCSAKPVDVAAVRKQALDDALQAIKSIPTPMYVETINGHEDAYRAVEALSPAEPAQGEQSNHIPDVSKMVDALKETRIDLVILQGNVADAAKTSSKWEGMSDRARLWIDRIDAALRAAPTTEEGK